MREVIGSAISTELEDPRIGFVTVTSVETSPDLRSARVFVSVLGGEAERDGDARRPTVLARRAPGRDRTGDADQANSHLDLPLRRDARARRPTLAAARRMSEVATRGRGARTHRSADVAEALRAGNRFLLTTHEGPDGDALGSLLAMHRILEPARQGLGDVPRGEGVPAAGRVPVPAPRGGLPRAADRRRGPVDRLPRLREHRPHAGGLPAARTKPWS